MFNFGRDLFDALPDAMRDWVQGQAATLVRAGRFGLGRMVELLCENPAKLFGLWPRKGVLAPGSDADVVLFDPECEVTITPTILATNCDYNPFDGRTVRGWPITTLLRGEVVVENRRFVGRPGQGRFLKRSPVAGRS